MDDTQDWDSLSNNMDLLKAKIRNVPDFPKAGILFYDISTLLRHEDVRVHRPW